MVVVCIEPKFPVMEAGPREVSNELGAADAGTADPSSDAITMASVIVRDTLKRVLQDIVIRNTFLLHS
jgi:hypothetical protein